MKSHQLSNILLIILNTFVDVNESNKGLQTEMLFSDFFCSADDPVALYTKGVRTAPGKQKFSGSNYLGAWNRLILRLSKGAVSGRFIVHFVFMAFVSY